MYYLEIAKNPCSVALSDIPVLDYPVFADQTVSLLKRPSFHCLNYFAFPEKTGLHFIILIANDDSHKIFIYSHIENHEVKTLESIAGNCFQLHVFEREIFENYGIVFNNHPWLKPVRYPFNRCDAGSTLPDYPFYKIGSEEVHEVGVGPVHAGIIEPGHFRFICHGEKVLHLEIQLGYQHRGMEELFLVKQKQIQHAILAESIAGDTAVGHGLAYTQLAEQIAEFSPGEILEMERTVSLEMERMAIHIGDTAALCGDVAYQLGQVACEALRTILINTMQDWCGNRFGKGLVRVGGSNYPITESIIKIICSRFTDVYRRFSDVADLIFSNPGIIGRFEHTGILSTRQAQLSGAVGMAARSAGLKRDIRQSHPFQAFSSYDYKPALIPSGDVYARAILRKFEIDNSFSVIMDLLNKIILSDQKTIRSPVYNMKYKKKVLGVSMVEGWRGEICHSVITDENGNICLYKIKDPSLHNWHLLALAVRNQEISDFPVCNKSFNLSYSGNDL